MKPVRLGPFDVYEVVGQGGMGSVRRGVYTAGAVDLEVAVKFVEPPREQFASSFREAFLREVQSAARLNHPNIVAVYDVGEVPAAAAEALQVPEQTPFLVMEYLAGGTLEQYVSRFRWTQLRDVLLRLLDALAHAHAMGIVHRDLKPANVLCAVHGQTIVPKLTDFGIARAMGARQDEPEEDEPQRVAGTPYYMAPEHVMGRWRDEGPWTDIYALGALTWHLVTGGVPYSGNTGDVLRAHLMADLPAFVPQVNLPDGFEDWLRRLLDKDLTQRYRRVADAAWALIQLGDPPLRTSRSTRELRPISLHEVGPTLSGLTATMNATHGGADRRESRRAVPKGGLAPPLPSDWREGEGAAPLQLAGAMGLYGLRKVPVVGREKERTLLWERLSAVHRSGAPGGVVITGVPGSGKSRIVEWLIERADALGGAIGFRATHTMSASENDGLAPMMARFTRTEGMGFESVLMRVRALYSDLEMTGENALFDAVALTERILGRRPELEQGPRFQARREWFGGLYRLFGGLTRERPVLIWLDDVHLNEESLAFARYVLSGEPEQAFPVLVVLSTPDVLGAPEQAQALADLRQIMALPNTEHIQLDPLTDAEIGELVGRLLGLSPGLAEQVVARTSGNPLFATQLVGDLVSRGALTMGPEGFVTAPDAVLQLPEDIRATWQARIDELVGRLDAPDDARAALTIAAVLGRDVHSGEWTRAATRAGIEIPAALVNSLISVGLAHRREKGFEFVHGLLRESLLTADAEALAAAHRVAAQALEDLYDPAPGRILERRATHWGGCGEHEAAQVVLTAAVARYREDEDHEGLLRVAKRLERLIDEHGQRISDPAHGAVWAERGTVMRFRGNAAAANDAIEAGLSFLVGDHDADWYVTHADAERNPALARLMVDKAILAFEAEGSLDASQELIELAAALANASDDAETRGWAAKTLSRVLCMQGRVEEGVVAAEDAIAAYGELQPGRVDLYFSAMCELSGALRAAGRLDDAARVMQEASAFAGRVASREALATANMERAEVARLQDRFDDARDHYRRAEELFRSLGGKHPKLVALNLCLVDIEEGLFLEPVERLESLRRELPNWAMEGLLGHVDLALCVCYAAAEQWDRFDDFLETCRRRFRQSGIKDPELAGLAVLAAKAAKGDPGRSRRALKVAEILGGVAVQGSRAADLEQLQSQLDPGK